MHHQNLIPKIIKWSDRGGNRPGASIVLLEVERKIEEVAGQIENTTDITREIAIGFTRGGGNGRR